MWDKTRFINEVSAQINMPFTKDQSLAIEQIYHFLFNGGPQSVFILKGYAGTGKTTLMGCLIRWFHSVDRKTVLLAPTGRSAKVLAAHSGYPASTIHRRIYSVKDDGSGRMSMELMANKSERTIFIVDEASMIGDASQSDGYFNRSLIHDLIAYVNSGEKCRLILIGDDAQLPPVGMDLSPALDKNELSQITMRPVFDYTLREVVRQDKASLILENATKLREDIASEQWERLSLLTDRNRDVTILEQDELEDELNNAFNPDTNEALIICRSNKDANQFNLQIRVRIFDRQQIIESGDRLMVVKNNYHWKIPGRRQNFLANGDMLNIDRVYAITEYGEFQFAECQVSLVDEEIGSFNLILLLNSLQFEGPNLPAKELKRLRQTMIDSGGLDPNESFEKFFQNPYFNAVQVKYAYAVTCHKSQGGQWSKIFLFQGYLTDEMLNKALYRWIYTAITRATSHLHLIGFHPKFLESN